MNVAGGGVDKEILVQETAGLSRVGEVVRLAVPFARAELRPEEPLCVLAPDGVRHPCQRQALKLWPDGSVKWLLVDCLVSVPAQGRACYRLVAAPTEAPEMPGPLSVQKGADAWHVDTGAGSFAVNSRTFGPLSEVKRGGVSLLAAGGAVCSLVADDGQRLVPVLKDLELEAAGPLRAILRLCGSFPCAGGEVLFYCRLHFFAGSMVVRVDTTLHNPRAAVHPGGLWDLGDPGSFLFRELSLCLPLAEGGGEQAGCLPEIGAEVILADAGQGLSIYQESSGGENWRHPTHRSRGGEVPLAEDGYRVKSGCSALLAAGRRASPVIWCGSGDCQVSATLVNFWQQFPKALLADGSALRLALFPEQFPELHELQGGEQKTHTAYLDFSARTGSLQWATAPLQPVCSPETYRRSGIFPDLPPGPGEDLVDRFVSPVEFFLKREAADEFGWRNFGDLHADHEGVYHAAGQPCVSHYNNQYDFCHGAYRKFFATGEPLWGLLAGDLARHVLDIDLYHTTLDREEYNRGLFWHTDHYIDAGLSTHRSFSREHLATKDPRFCGGGPGAEHCYTTGLALHYFQTGDPRFRSAVLDLADWCLLSLKGPQTVLASLKRGLRHARCWRAGGGKAQPFPRFPLTRGTGNALTACLDAFEVGGGTGYLDTAFELIRGALHPDDDITLRDLLNAETAWSYTVLLAAVGKYLDKKREIGSFDKGFWYARASLLSYARWMAEHEYPYLEKPEILEYPNETWAAQDLRKAVVFYHAARYAPGKGQAGYWDKAREFAAKAEAELCRHQSARLTRPLVLMLQNGWVVARVAGDPPAPFSYSGEGAAAVSGPPTPCLNGFSLVARITSDLFDACRATSLRREWAWLKSRLT